MGGRTIHIIENQRKKLEEEKYDLTLQSNMVKHDIEQRIKNMEDSFELTKANHAKAMENIQENLESISKAKAEAYRDKQNLEQTVIEIDGALNQSQMKSLDLNNM